VALLDEALARLPPITRAVLVERFVYESSHAQIATRLGLSPDAVSMRVSRGKIMLRGLLEPRLGEEATRSGPVGGGWQQTRVWCDCCGRRRLLMRRELPPGAVSFRCPGCSADPQSVTSLLSLANPFFATLVGDLVRPSAILARTAQWVHHYYTEGLERGQVDCTRCGRRVPLQRGHPDPGRDSDAPPSAYAACEACGEAVSTSLHGLALAQPEIRRFGRGSRRLRELSGTRVDPAGSRTVVAFEDLVTAAHLEVEFDQETWRVLAVHGVPS
jgi:hypothetical protein